MDERTLSIIKKYKTPLYVFDEEEIENQIKKLKQQSAKSYGLCFAVKANPFIVEMLNPYVDRFEACSPGEYQILLDKKISTTKIVYSGVNKRFEDMEEIISKKFDGIITVESKQQWKNMVLLASKYQHRPNVIVRLSSGNQFGVSYNDLLTMVLENKVNDSCKLLGVHFFSGTQKKNIKEIEKELIYIDTCCKKIKNKADVTIGEIEYGAGLYAEYFSEEDDSEYLAAVYKFIDSSLCDYRVTIELGRYIAYTCGRYFTSVVDVKNTGKNNYAIVDGGIHQLMYYGQLLGIRVPPIICHPNRKGIDDEYIVCGSLCSINDILIKRWKGQIKVADVFEFQKAGAYCCTEGSALFLSRDLPAVVNLYKSEIVLEREHQNTYRLNE